ncbi:MAG: GNAT family N-acetyltransferase [Burkholderiales bacterium]
MVAKNLTLRIATADDAQAIAEMSRDLIERGLGWSWTPQRVSRHIRNRDTTTIVACEGSHVIGFAIMYFGDEHAHLNLLAVEPTYQRTGIGNRMMNWLKESCLMAGIAVVYLELRANNDAGRQFYGVYGFEETGSVPRYYFGVETAVCMALRLRPETVGNLPG